MQVKKPISSTYIKNQKFMKICMWRMYTEFNIQTVFFSRVGHLGGKVLS